ncbi:RidA family protein [Actinoallomurus bryophytorum]|uniref:Enamine deaminase RidA (YjgF/YER057c/UK114 family) n=1 Tax=Actinoallomurus bryophytorum TaxID=1490222 RepID=A0A543CPB2_9ACTN|nr:RidA family protein [Actinoallomurus bryophytorum]TQL98942.1 enamine deaminase RidA (YjgF/YER057c/UK114 family) [Actinoallomurus bryophytorum]
MIRRWSPDGLAAPIGQYSHLAAAPPDHELIFIAGQVGVLEDGTLAGTDGESQTRQAFANIGVLLNSLGAGPENLVKLVTMVSAREHLAGCRAAREEVFAAWYPGGDWPAHSLMVVDSLATPELTVEIEGFAAVPR